MFKLWCPFTMLLLFIASPSKADDGNSQIGLGGIEFKKTDAISMETEDLFLSASKVRVKFSFKNITTKDFHTTVAFPVPEYSADLSSCDYGMNTICDDAGRINSAFSTFSVKVDGKKIEPKIEIKAFCEGKEITATLEKYKIPIDDSAKVADILKKLPTSVKKELLDKKIIRPVELEGDIKWEETSKEALPNGGFKTISTMKKIQDNFNPEWDIRRIYYWEQVFPVGKLTHIEHEYVPIMGISQAIATEDEATYCIDPPIKKSAEKIREENSKKFPESAAIFTHTMDYILTSANSWSGSIKDFKLTIEKPKQDDLLSLCFEGIKKIGPKTFQSHLKNFIPHGELKLIFISNPHGKN